MKRILTILFLVPIFCSGQISVARKLLLSQYTNTSSTIPQFIDDGGIGTSTGSLVFVPYPETNANDILIAVLMDEDDDTFVTPSTWNSIDSVSTNTSLSVHFFWKRATGSETGSVGFPSASTSGSLCAGIIYRFSGCITTGNPIGEISNAIVTNSLGVGERITTSNNNSLEVGLYVVEDNVNATLSGSNWTEFSNKTTTVGNDAAFVSIGYELPVAGIPLSLPSLTWSTYEYCGFLTIELRSE